MCHSVEHRFGPGRGNGCHMQCHTACSDTPRTAGEEGGVLGDVKSEYLWCIDPLDGTANFSTGAYPTWMTGMQASAACRLHVGQPHCHDHVCAPPSSCAAGYMHFCCSVGVLRHATPVAGVVIEFVGGGPGGVGGYVSRKFTAARNRGAFLDGKPLQVSGTRKLEDALVVGQS